MITTAEHLQMISDCYAREARLSDWERGFINSLGAQVDSGCSLTESQIEALDRIWNKATERG